MSRNAASLFVVYSESRESKDVPSYAPYGDFRHPCQEDLQRCRNMIIQGEKVTLRPMAVEEIPIFYKWATQSDSTPFWYGKLYSDHIPTYEEFTRDWKRYYFDGSEPEKGRCFMILVV